MGVDALSHMLKDIMALEAVGFAAAIQAEWRGFRALTPPPSLGESKRGNARARSATLTPAAPHPPYIIECPCPPSTTMQAPVMSPARSDAKNAAKSPTGSGQPNRPIGRLRDMKSATTSGGFSF